MTNEVNGIGPAGKPRYREGTPCVHQEQATGGGEAVLIPPSGAPRNAHKRNPACSHQGDL
jgi:hypothetical protein